jgi:flagellar biosynthetic protein FlhB
MADDSGGEKSFEATDQRREEFRKQGRYAKAKDVGGLVATAGVVLGVIAARRQLVGAFDILFARSVGDMGALERLGTMGALRAAATPIVGEAGPILVGAATLALLASASQVGFRINTDAITVKFDRLDPKQGLEKLIAFGKNSAELGLSLLRVLAVGGVAYEAVARELPVLLSVARAPLVASADTAAAAVARVVISILVALVVVSAADFGYAWFTLEQELKMTRKERIDESRQQDGDPKAKGRMKARARAIAKNRAVQSVTSADVIVTNPTHIAVALRYGPKDVAPIVVAKGTDEIALKIRAEARRLGIPIMENRPLARALHAEVAVGRVVPQAHFAAVAQVLAFVYRLKKRGAIGGTRRA